VKYERKPDLQDFVNGGITQVAPADDSDNAGGIMPFIQKIFVSA
jgi:hypothetical protein